MSTSATKPPTSADLASVYAHVMEIHTVLAALHRDPKLSPENRLAVTNGLRWCHKAQARMVQADSSLGKSR